MRDQASAMSMPSISAPRAPGGSRRAAVRAQWCRSSSASSRLRIAAVSAGSAWSWPSTWSTPCTTSRASSSSSVPACSGAWLGGHAGTDDDVAEEHRHAVPAGSSDVERERQHVGRAVVTEVLDVQRGDLVAVDERQRQLADARLRSSSTAAPGGTTGRRRRRRRPARRHPRRRPAAPVVRVGLGGSVTSASRSAPTGVAVALVGGDDVGDDAVADDVRRRQVHEGEPVDAGRAPAPGRPARSCRWGRRSA